MARGGSYTSGDQGTNQTDNLDEMDELDELNELAKTAHERFIELDRTVVNELARRSHHRLMRFLQRSCDAREPEASDAAQRVLENLDNLVRRYDCKRSFSGLLNDAGRKRLLDIERKESRERRKVEHAATLSDAQTVQPPPLPAIIDDEAGKRILEDHDRCWGQLTPREQLIIKLRFPDLPDSTTLSTDAGDLDAFLDFFKQKTPFKWILDVCRILRRMAPPGAPQDWVRAEAGWVHNEYYRSVRKLLACLGVVPQGTL